MALVFISHLSHLLKVECNYFLVFPQLPCAAYSSNNNTSNINNGNSNVAKDAFNSTGFVCQLIALFNESFFRHRYRESENENLIHIHELCIWQFVNSISDLRAKSILQMQPRRLGNFNFTRSTHDGAHATTLFSLHFFCIKFQILIYSFARLTPE
jgi:hypothetical protein